MKLLLWLKRLIFPQKSILLRVNTEDTKITYLFKIEETVDVKEASIFLDSFKYAQQHSRQTHIALPLPEGVTLDQVITVEKAVKLETDNSENKNPENKNPF